MKSPQWNTIQLFSGSWNNRSEQVALQIISRFNYILCRGKYTPQKDVSVVGVKWNLETYWALLISFDLNSGRVWIILRPKGQLGWSNPWLSITFNFACIQPSLCSFYTCLVHLLLLCVTHFHSHLMADGRWRLLSSLHFQSCWICGNNDLD